MSGSESLDYAKLVGAWSLESAVATAEDGRTWYPFGEEPQGVLLYTPDRWVSATITSVGTARPSGGCFYAGPVVLSGADIEHRVVVGQAPFGPGTVQTRGLRLSGSELELSARTTDRVPVTTRLRWRRPSV